MGLIPGYAAWALDKSGLDRVFALISVLLIGLNVYAPLAAMTEVRVDASEPDSLCSLPSENAKLVEALLSRVDDFYLASQRKRWRYIVNKLMYPHEHEGDLTWRRRQVRIWSEESRYLEETAWRKLLIRQCGVMSLVTTRVWWRDSYPSEPEKRSGFTDEHTWWVYHHGEWFNTEEFEALINGMSRSLGGSYEGTAGLYLESPRENFAVVWEAPSDTKQ